MTEVKSGPAPYIYTSTRLRVRKAKLLPREDYLRMQNMSLPEIARFIGESEYKSEIDELGGVFHGIDLIEIALSWNLAKENQSVLGITQGSLMQFTANYLRSWDIANVLIILRGKQQGFSVNKIKEVVIPAGELDKVFLDRLLVEESAGRIVELLKGWRLYPVLEREYSAVVERGSFARLENELYKKNYADLIAVARSGIKGGSEFLQYLQLEIDTRNFQSLFRLRASGMPEDVREQMIPGGTFSLDELARLGAVESNDELIDALKKRTRLQSLIEALETFREGRPIHEIENVLTRIKLEQMDRMSKRYPFSIAPILVYLEKKKYEVFNLRALARGKESNLPGERIMEYLVI